MAGLWSILHHKGVIAKHFNAIFENPKWITVSYFPKEQSQLSVERKTLCRKTLRAALRTREDTDRKAGSRMVGHLPQYGTFLWSTESVYLISWCYQFMSEADNGQWSWVGGGDTLGWKGSPWMRTATAAVMAWNTVFYSQVIMFWGFSQRGWHSLCPLPHAATRLPVVQKQGRYKTPNHTILTVINVTEESRKPSQNQSWPVGTQVWENEAMTQLCMKGEQEWVRWDGEEGPR